MTKKLTPRQRRFVREYLVDLNSSAAYRRAGYAAKDANVAGPRLLADVRIAAEVERLKGEREQATETTAEWVLRELRAIWDAKITDILTDDYRLRPLSEWPDIWLKMTSSIEVKEIAQRSHDGTIEGDSRAWDKVGEHIKTKTADKLSALCKIGEHVTVKAFPQKVQMGDVHIHLDELSERLAEGRERARLAADQEHEDRVH